MPLRRLHNKSCQKRGISKDNCDFANKKMDEFSQIKPGCAHREEGHGFMDRIDIASQFATLTYQNCKIEDGNNCLIKSIKGFFDSLKASGDHIRLDIEDSRKKGTCGFS